jgi:hypothetical protein
MDRIRSKVEPSMVVHTCNPSTQEGHVEGLQNGGQTEPYQGS